MLDERKAAILRAVVEEYIQTAQPVGSASVSRIHELSVSSATVRNEMGVLEREGYLTQPHTSAGRIPTDKGYRFFVDHLDPAGRLDPGQTQKVRSFFARAHGELERMLGDTSKLLSGLTDYAAVVVREGEPARVRTVQLVGLAPRIFLVVVVFGSGAVDKRTIELGPGEPEPSEAQISAASVHLGSQLVGEVLGRRESLISTGDTAVDHLAASALEALLRSESRDDPHSQVFVGGAARMAEAFDAVATIRQVLDILEQQYVLVTVIRDVLDRGLSVAIGAEHGVVPLAECSIVVAPYQVEGERAGTVGILGPTRMHYDHALAAVAVVSKRLGQTLTEGAEGR
ncbi:MAG TPA: heat-inducible transcriptional repressor HrcA [Acidimicrobiales bacterium]|nr:heat-inducible transcriptional repressor HrcA [Acidimicrobiales bacterium]